MSDADTKTDDAAALSTDPIEVRRQKRDRLIELGVDPYPIRFRPSATTAELAERHKDLEDDVVSDEVATVAGRIYSMRNSGMFMDLRDASGKIQIFSHKNSTPKEALELLPLIEVGDIIGVKGPVRRTKRGELTVNAEEITVLCKALKPMPEKHHGLTDVETRFRRRYLDVMVNEESRDRLRARSRILSELRNFMVDQGFMEVETPMLHPIYGGASAEPFVTHHNALDQDMYLRIAPELYLKRILVSGVTDRVFEINRNFRNEGLSTRHNPEFTMMEVYWAYADYTDIMQLVEDMCRRLCVMLHGEPVATFGEHKISFENAFPRLSMPDAVKAATGLDFLAMTTDEEARKAVASVDLEIDKSATWGECLAHVFEEKIEETLIQPTHVTDFPKDISPFAKVTDRDPRLVERFETYCNAWEIGNAFSELNDPVEQRRRMVEQVEQAHARGEKERELDEDFLNAMDHGMPNAGGLGVGVDRLIMILTDSKSIREVIFFPTLRKV